MENASPTRVAATGSWTFLIGPEFELVNNGDSVQAVHGTRVVYVSSLRIGTPEQSVRAAEIRAAAARHLGPGERLSFVGRWVQGDAEIRPNGGAWCLRGSMCADGTVATCVVDFHGSDDRNWAVSVWRSLLSDGEAA